MPETYFFPLIGVILGWFLSNVSSAYGKKYEYKNRLGKGVTQLALLHSDLSQVVRAFDHYKSDVNSWKNYEHVRNRIMINHFDNKGITLNKIDEIFTEVSGIDPELALRILGIKKGLQETKLTPMDKICENEELYIKLICSQEAILILTCNSLEKIIKKISLKHSLATYIKMRKRIHAINNYALAEEHFDFPRLKNIKIKKDSI